MPLRQQNVFAAQWTPNGDHIGAPDLTTADNQIFGENVFSPAIQRQRLPKDVYKRLSKTLAKGSALDTSLADAVALAMKEWALEKGATHYSHVFQPLTGLTAEKHDSFYSPTGEGTALAEFSGKELIQAEPDASSFPTGGIRATFEARGYTAWDPTSPAFILENPNGALLCIPTAFVSWTGEALDHKIPLLRSMDALSKSAIRALKLFGNDEASRVFTTVGPEQEYFLIDEQYYFERPDLVTTGRTLFGAKPPKGHELDDHYFGSIPERVLACMLDTERELAKLGVPIKTRHNEVAPAQYEVAPIFENSNVGADHQQLTMQIMQNVARRYGLVCLLHEKPFAGVNGSGKHNNWSMGTDSGENLLEPGDTPHENLQFLFFCAAVIQAVNKHQGLLRASIASPGQDHRLGANEAPPAIISIFLGAELEKVFGAIERGEVGESTPESFLGLGTPVLPRLPMHGGDRNRTSPFAFTGNKFEFRALGSSMSLSLPNTVLNTIVAEAIDYLAEELEDARQQGTELEAALRPILQRSYAANKQIVFGGDNYSDQWHSEAEQRGLLNLRSTPDALPYLMTDDTQEVFSNYGVLSPRELESRYEVFLEQYVTKLNIEAETAASIARTMIVPAAARYIALLAGAQLPELAKEVGDALDRTVDSLRGLEAANLAENQPEDEDILRHAEYMRDAVIPAMAAVREGADDLEKLVADDLWPLPKYSEILFIK
ncbi:MAG: glutamine synthetase [Solirubrobacteraceae bacterium]|jgi:glutamine synthetase|nr:glutamine synthetase [Solirubrobacteraceae bacterium]